ncbi:MAG: DUF5703 domain-containing protein [Lentisphaerae bacterium]|nr:DUF5703 domain-containing protein [Lentisphaerota bacterium]
MKAELRIISVLIVMSFIFKFQTAVKAEEYVVTEAPADPLDTYNVVWDSPSQDHTGSMPVGNGDVGANVWVEPNGDLVLLLAKTDAWSEDANLLKVGRARVKFQPNPFDGGAAFEQTLHLRQGEIRIRAGASGREI